jgi:hypothetical protein
MITFLIGWEINDVFTNKRKTVHKSPWASNNCNRETWQWDPDKVSTWHLYKSHTDFLVKWGPSGYTASFNSVNFHGWFVQVILWIQQAESI